MMMMMIVLSSSETKWISEYCLINFNVCYHIYIYILISYIYVNLAYFLPPLSFFSNSMSSDLGLLLAFEYLRFLKSFWSTPFIDCLRSFLGL